MSNNSTNPLFKIDVLSVGLFGLAVGALTLGFVQIGFIPAKDSMAISIICLVFGGLVQILAGLVDIRYNDQLGGTALTMYGFFWTTVFTVKILDLAEGFHWDSVLYFPMVMIYCLFSAMMIYLTAHKNFTLCLLHVIITCTFAMDTMIKLNNAPLELYVGIGHLLIGSLALYHAMGTLVNKFDCFGTIPLGNALLPMRNESTGLQAAMVGTMEIVEMVDATTHSKSSS
ncbi:MAG: acetate uptake transporter [Cyanobacteria bacterium HKST-UBA06]|nr:acetate uptake transporter [Cyanobacteria bacterium HKST-UBA04]MCA9807399.1 acetate uptake transporter [Cyanobacteria bacterium HKST-UBA06]MCA9842302.1 acetate uptake transporter [Cyanobacteria bacterium HKST-UBA03]